MTEWIIRESWPGDLSFIYSSWLQSFRKDSFMSKVCSSHLYYKYYCQVIDAILSKDETKIAVAAHSWQEPEVIFAYLVYDSDSMHYAFTKEPFRRLNMMKSLYEAAASPRVFTHVTHSIKPILEKHPDLEYNPFLLYVRGIQNGETV